MRLLLIFLFPILGTIIPMLAPAALAQVPGTVGISGKTAYASYISGEFCDHTTIGDKRVEGVKGILTELSTGEITEWISLVNGKMPLSLPDPGLISYEGILPDRYYTDAYLSDPRTGLTSFDLIKLNGFLLGNTYMCSYTRLSADMNRDGFINQADHDLMVDLILNNTGNASNPYPYDHWVIMPKLTTIPNQQHPDLIYLTDFWNNMPVQNSETEYPFVADLDVLGDHYEYEDNICDWKGKVKKWDMTDEVECCFRNSFDFYVGKSGDLNNSIDSCSLDGNCAEPFEVICNTPDDERYFDIIPYQGGYVAAGHANSQTPGFGTDVLVVRMNLYGEIMWSKTYGGPEKEVGYSVDETSDGKIFVTASTKSVVASREDIYVLKIDDDGTLLFDNSFEGSNDNNQFNGAYSRGAPTDDGGFILGGYTSNYQSPGWRSFYPIKIDANGDLEWSKAIGGNNNDWVAAVETLEEEEFLFCGNTASGGMTSGFHDLLIVKTDENGDEEWSKSYGSTFNDAMGGGTELSDGNLLITGSFGTNSGYNNTRSVAVVLKLDEFGDLLWAKSYSTGGTGKDHAYKAIETTDGYVIMGRSNQLPGSNLYDAVLFKTDTDGNLLWTQRYGDDAMDDYLLSAHADGPSDFIFAGFTREPGGDWDLFLQKTDSLGNVYNHCLQDSPPMIVTDITPGEISPAVITVDVDLSLPTTTSIRDYDLPCYQYCVLESPPVAARNNSPRAVRVADRLNSNRRGDLRKIRIAIQSKAPIDGFGMELNIDPQKFAINNVQDISTKTMELKMNTNKENLVAGQLKLLSFSGKEPLNCEEKMAFIEIEGRLLGDENDLLSFCQIANGNLPMEFISQEKLLTRDEYRVFINWAE